MLVSRARIFYISFLVLSFVSCKTNKSYIQIGKYNGTSNGYDLTIELKKDNKGFICLNYLCVVDGGEFVNESFTEIDNNLFCSATTNKESKLSFDVINYRDFSELNGTYNRFIVTLEIVNQNTIVWNVNPKEYGLLPYLPHHVELKKVTPPARPSISN